MTCFRYLRGVLTGTVLACLVALGPSLVWSQDEKPAAEEKPAAKEQPGDESGPIKVPDGPVEELLKFIEQISEQQIPPGLAQDAAKEALIRRLRALAEAGGKVLGAKPNEDQALTAIRARLTALLGLQQLGEADAAKQIEELPGQLKTAGFPKYARGVAGHLLQRRLMQARAAGPEEVKKIADEVAKFLAAEPVGREDVGLAINTAMLLEQSDSKLAAEAYASFGKTFKSSQDKELAGLGEKMEGAARRLGLVGGPIEIEGKLLDGKKLDWGQFKDKAVLVWFWATWCKPCVGELPNVKAIYGQYHGKGFEVVAISCDNDKAQLEEFVKDREVPWTILYSDDPQAAGMDNPMANKYGILGIPTMILVGRDGKVISLNARGRVLAAELEKIYGPPPKAPEKTEEKPE